MQRLLLLLPLLSLACAQESLDLQAAPHLTPSTDPTVLGTIDERVGPIAVDAERLYWLGSQQQYFTEGAAALRSCRKQDCAGSLVTYTSNAAPNFRVQNGYVYWSRVDDAGNWQIPGHGSILRCEVSGCAEGTPDVVAEVSGQVSFNSGSAGSAVFDFELAVTGDAIYYGLVKSEPFGDEAFSIGLYRVPFSGNTPAVAIARVVGLVWVLSVHGDYLYWLEGPRDQLFKLLTLRRVRVSGDAAPETLAENLEIPPYPDYGSIAVSGLSLAFDSRYVYWSQGTLDGSIVRCPLAGCSGVPEVVAPKIRRPVSLLLEGSVVHWLHDTNSQGFAVSSCTLGDCASPHLVASGLNLSNALAIDDQSVYTAMTEGDYYPTEPVYNPVAQIRRFPK